MQGTSTKLTAAGAAGLVITILAYALFSAGWGPQWEVPPPEVTSAFTTLIAFVLGFWVKETAVNNQE